MVILVNIMSCHSKPIADVFQHVSFLHLSCRIPIKVVSDYNKYVFKHIVMKNV